MVIVEPRAHPDLQYVLENFDKNMPLYYDLYIFHGKSYGGCARMRLRSRLDVVCVVVQPAVWCGSCGRHVCWGGRAGD